MGEIQKSFPVLRDGNLRVVTNCGQPWNPFSSFAELRLNEETFSIFEIFNPSVPSSVAATSPANKACIVAQGE